MSKVWHYAPKHYLSRIVATGMLLPSNAGAEHEVPMLWFSSNQEWEPTATKLMRDSLGIVRSISFIEQCEIWGCMRFGISKSDSRLMGWKDACKFAGTTRKQREQMEKVGREKGGNPRHWFATQFPIPLAEVQFEIWEGGQWIQGGKLNDQEK